MTALYAPRTKLAYEGALSHKLWVDLPKEATIPEPGHGALLGTQIEPRIIAQQAYNAGWKDALDLATAVCVCLAESQGYDRAIHVNLNGTQDRGIWQLSTVHRDITDAIAYDYIAATDAAYDLYVSAGKTFRDWVAFTSGVYLHDSYVGRAWRAVGNFLGETMIAWPVPDLPNGTPYHHRFGIPALNFEHRLAGSMNYVAKARKDLGWQAFTKAKADLVQHDLSAAQAAAKQSLPN